jgi:4-amino-4-deoxy-L-arabinose transferase-like glycosyltransferase
MLPRRGRSRRGRLPGVGPLPLGWADLVVIPLTVALSVPSLARFGDDWTVGKDAVRYLFAGSEIVSGQSLHTPGGVISNGGHGPIFPALIGSLILVFGRDVGALAWSVRLLALPNALLAYLLARRVSGRFAGLVAAALLTLFCTINLTFNIDTVLLAFCLTALLALTGAIGRNSSVLALLSGVLLGAAILTKETAIVYAPLALLAVLLLGWEAREPLWHYLGLSLVCLPWWVLYYSVTGGLYLLDRLPPSLRLLLLIATAALLAVGSLSYSTGALGRYLAGERRRRWTGWLVMLAWTVSLTGLALYAGGPALAEVSSKSLRLYLANLLAPEIVVVPALILAFSYAFWRASRRDAGWTLLALALLFQVPVCVLVAVEEWRPRQYLVLAALVFCALADLVVDAAGAAWRGTRGYAARLQGALVAGVLIGLLVVASVERVEAQLPQKASGGSPGRHEVSPQATRMAHWMAEHVPEDQDVLILPAYSLNNYLMFQDGGRHDWSFLRMDQQPCKPRPNGRMRCNPTENDISRIPPDAIWVHIGERCNASSLSMSNLLRQLRRTRSGYLMISGGYKFAGIMGLTSRLEESGAFEVVHGELDKGTSGRNESLVLMKSTGRKPEAVPALMQAKTAQRLRRCEQAEGPGSVGRIRSSFPNGIRLPVGTWVLSGRT